MQLCYTGVAYRDAAAPRKEKQHLVLRRKSRPSPTRNADVFPLNPEPPAHYRKNYAVSIKGLYFIRQYLDSYFSKDGCHVTDFVLFRCVSTPDTGIKTSPLLQLSHRLCRPSSLRPYVYHAPYLG